MTWKQRYVVRRFLKNSVWFMPFLGMLFAMGFVRLEFLDRSHAWVEDNPQHRRQPGRV